MRDKKHPRWRDILDTVEGIATGTESIYEHLSGCPDCARTADEARRLLDALGRARLPAVPEPAVAGALGAVAAEIAHTHIRRSHGEGLAGAKEALLALLVLDSLAPSPVLRGSAVAEPRMLLYETEGYSITLSLMAGESAGPSRILGQIAPAGTRSLGSGGRAALVLGDARWECGISSHGEFCFEGASELAGRIKIEIEGRRIRLALPNEPGKD